MPRRVAVVYNPTMFACVTASVKSSSEQNTTPPLATHSATNVRPAMPTFDPVRATENVNDPVEFVSLCRCKIEYDADEMFDKIVGYEFLKENTDISDRVTLMIKAHKLSKSSSDACKVFRESGANVPLIAINDFMITNAMVELLGKMNGVQRNYTIGDRK